MEQDNGYVLEQSRDDKLKMLGALCYNLYIDGVMIFPEMNETVNDIKNVLTYLLVLRKNNINADYLKIQESGLSEKIQELGCICYNLYVDSKLFNSKVLSLCDSISSINHEIKNGLEAASQGSSEVQEREDLKKMKGEYRNVTKSKLKVICPYGMEPIPINYKKCACGYKNRASAKYCGKCGAKLA